MKQYELFHQSLRKQKPYIIIESLGFFRDGAEMLKLAKEYINKINYGSCEYKMWIADHNEIMIGYGHKTNFFYVANITRSEAELLLLETKDDML